MENGSKIISVRLDSDTVEALEKFWADDFRTVAATIRMFTVKALQEKGYVKEVKP